jgi:hypothetical protein
MKRTGLLATCLFFAVVAASAQQPAAAGPNWKFHFNGYYESLFSASQSIFTNDSYADSLNRLRLSLEGRRGSTLFFHVDLDNEAHFGNMIQLPDFELVRQRQAGTYFDLLHVNVDESNVYWDTSIYRAYLELRSNHAMLTVGRQRIAWGTARFWSPADVFNPISPLQIEFDQRQGVDAAQLDLSLPKNLIWTIVYAPQDGFNRSALATRLATTWHNYDVAGFVGRFGQDWMAGGEFAGQWGGAGLRGEATYTWRSNPAELNALRFAAGSDYAFTPKFYLVGEYFYNQGQPAGLVPGQALDPAVLLRFTREIFTLHRHFLSAGATYELTPLLRLESYAVVDLQGPSAYYMPVVRYSLTANTELSVGAQLFTSAQGGEFQPLHNLVYAEFLAHF